ncbi:MAG: hypothetical protein ABIG10_02565 [bacterium]
MNLQNLQNLIQANRLEEFDISLKSIKAKYNQAVRRFNLAKDIMAKGSKNNDLAYSDIYDAARLACESLLWLYGYRVKQRQGHHAMILEVAGLILNGDLELEFKRIKKMRKKRHDIQYDVLEILDTELIKIAEDVETFLRKVVELIEKKDLQKKLI